jgi:hypothetical protein
MAKWAYQGLLACAIPLDNLHWFINTPIAAANAAPLTSNAAPEVRQRISCARATADCQPGSQHRCVHRSDTHGADAVDFDTFVFKEPIEHSPCKSAVRAPPWSAKLIRFRLGELASSRPSRRVFCLCSFKSMPIFMQAPLHSWPEARPNCAWFGLSGASQAAPSVSASGGSVELDLLGE